MLMAMEGRFVKKGRHVVHGGLMPHIGYGHRLYEEELPQFQKGIGEGEAESLLTMDAERAATNVREAVKVPLSQSEFDALVMLAYNIGDAGFRSSGVLQRLNEGHRSQAAEAFFDHVRFHKGRGESSRGPEASMTVSPPSPAIRRRRGDENYLFRTGRYIELAPKNGAESS